MIVQNGCDHDLSPLWNVLYIIHRSRNREKRAGRRTPRFVYADWLDEDGGPMRCFTRN